MRSYIFLLPLFFVNIGGDVGYRNKRNEILQAELSMAVGGRTQLSDKEQKVNSCLMQHKFYEVDRGYNNPHYFNLSHHFFNYKDNIRKSKVYKIIRDMPKGAVLHIHDVSILGPDYLLKLTYSDHLYVCFEVNGNLNLKFSNRRPSSKCTTKWELMSYARRRASNITKFDADLRKHFTMVVQNPDIVYPTITETWEAFMNYFITITPLLTYRPVWEQYFYDALLKFREENIMYVEVRTTLPPLYELDGTSYTPMITAKAYRKTISKFTKQYPDFVGVKIIYAPLRLIEKSVLIQDLQLAKRLKQNVPEIFAGFDLVGQEDLGKPLIDFFTELTEAGKYLNYFFHAGETDWYGTLSDNNLIDAILLGAKRLGHGYALTKHPLFIKELLARNIGIEVNVISNTVLSLVEDVRNHPLSVYIAQGLPVVISSDDPGTWEADLLSDDFYVAFVAVASRLDDLKLLKTLALNSLQYSALDSPQKEQAISKFQFKWNDFIDNFNCSSY